VALQPGEADLPIRGITGNESLVCRRIAAFSPLLGRRAA
jgi:hypothetical protein